MVPIDSAQDLGCAMYMYTNVREKYAASIFSGEICKAQYIRPITNGMVREGKI
jgi:hypothetical protein